MNHHSVWLKYWVTKTNQFSFCGVTRFPKKITQKIQKTYNCLKVFKPTSPYRIFLRYYLFEREMKEERVLSSWGRGRRRNRLPTGQEDQLWNVVLISGSWAKCKHLTNWSTQMPPQHALLWHKCYFFHETYFY